MKARKPRNYEPIRYTVKWIEGNMMYFRAFKRDAHAMKFQDYLIEELGISPANVRVSTK